MAGGIEVNISGARKHLKDQRKLNDKEVKSLVHQCLGLGERVMKHAVPVMYGFLKNSIHSQSRGDTGEIYAGVAYATRRNYENLKNPHKTGYIEKTESAINKFITEYKRK